MKLYSSVMVENGHKDNLTPAQKTMYLHGAIKHINDLFEILKKVNHMKTSMLLFTVWILAVDFVSGQVPAVDQIKTEPVTVNTGFSFKFHSAILNEDRTIFIALPDGYNNQTKKYPVLYMVDGQWNFNHTAQTLAWLSRCDAGIIPHTIVVGIHTGENRERDLTRTQNKENKTGGGADIFYKFLKEELIPFIDKNYSTYNYRVLGGVSFRGTVCNSRFY